MSIKPKCTVKIQQLKHFLHSYRGMNVFVEIVGKGTGYSTDPSVKIDEFKLQNV